MRPIASELRLNGRLLTLATFLDQGTLLGRLGYQQAQLGRHRQQPMPLGCTGGIDQEAILFRGPETESTPDALVQEHLTLGRSRQHDAVNTGLIKAFREHRTARQRLQAAAAYLAVDGLPFVGWCVANDRRCREPSTAKGMLDRRGHRDSGAKD